MVDKGMVAMVTIVNNHEAVSFASGRVTKGGRQAKLNGRSVLSVMIAAFGKVGGGKWTLPP